MVAVLQGRNIRSKDEMHAELARALEFPAYYGRNLDALWDCLASVETPTTIIWKDFAATKAALGSIATDVVEVLREAEGIQVQLD